MPEHDPHDTLHAPSRPARSGAEGSASPDPASTSSSSLFGPTGFGPYDTAATAPRGAGSAFDVCHVGVVLRALLFVHVTLAVAVSFGATDFASWLTLLAAVAGVALPALLLWLVLACLLKRMLVRLPAVGQWAAALLLGAASGVFGWGLQGAVGFGPAGSRLPWVPPALAGALLAAAMFYWLTLRARARLPADAAARLIELQSRIRPHFLFNTLNTAITLARLDPARTEGLLEDLAELFRVALNDTGASVTLAEEVSLAQRYLAIEQVRFGERLQVSWELDDDAGSARVPPLLLQPLVENAVRHGVEPAPDGGVVRIRTRVKRAHAVVTIVNTLPQQPSRPGNGIALRNVRERLRLMHDVAAQFETRLDKDFFRVQIVVPL
ncbi:sensor histidine kinase [Piscinibacter sp. HJYY11]|uniref:sensor histidine kinase n=1 Tax=Piscinibacter sp. HJYY11 TaxID=2801333 RepID=UPI00191F766C|nr:histidine kinase [Piscinibacter sp. HJYY11]MBL0727705.1 histidine kinase [Piscinibacter sp. HJYY11]